MKSDAFRAAVESKDLSGIEEIFSETPRFVSPAVHKPYEGIEAMKAVLGSAVQVFEDFSYIDHLENDDRAVLIFKARVGEKDVNGVDILTFDADGRVDELMVMVRPLRGLEAVVRGMGEKLAEMGVPAPGTAA
jgi:SnoaL-like protein